MLEMYLKTATMGDVVKALITIAFVGSALAVGVFGIMLPSFGDSTGLIMETN